MPTISAVPFGSLVGAQLKALIQAEIEAAELTSEFIDAVGFEQQEDGSQRLRMVSFEMERLDVDGVVRTHTISVPVLTLVPIPLLTIEGVDMEFDLHVETTVPDESEKPQSGASDPVIRNPRFPTLGGAIAGRGGVPTRKVNLITRLAKTTPGETKTKSDLHVKVKVAQSPFPLGIERLLNTADLSVNDDAPADDE